MRRLTLFAGVSARRMPELINHSGWLPLLVRPDLARWALGGVSMSVKVGRVLCPK